MFSHDVTAQGSSMQQQRGSNSMTNSLAQQQGVCMSLLAGCLQLVLYRGDRIPG
jgi:hypothetical protein